MHPPEGPSKAELRSRMRATLRSMESAERAEQASATRAALRAWPTWANARCVMGFLPLAGEVDLRPLLQQAIDRGITVCVPVSADDGSIIPAQVRSLEPSALQQDAKGVAVPRHVDPVALSDLQVVLVPGLAFDAAGRRLGRGGGFYDRFLPRLGVPAATVGVAFPEQMLAAVPSEPHDARVGWLAISSGVVAAQPVAPI